MDIALERQFRLDVMSRPWGRRRIFGLEYSEYSSGRNTANMNCGTCNGREVLVHGPACSLYLARIHLP